MRKIIYKKLTIELTEIILTESGFSINQPFGAKPILHNWIDIRDIRFSVNYKELIIEKPNGQIVLKNNSIGWYEFIQNVPSTFTLFDFKYVIQFMNSLKPCGVCGIIAVKEKECLVCKTAVWNDKMNKSETEYLKSKQSEFYSESFEKGLEVKKNTAPEHGFKADKHWKLYI